MISEDDCKISEALRWQILPSSNLCDVQDRLRIFLASASRAAAKVFETGVTPQKVRADCDQLPNRIGERWLAVSALLHQEGLPAPHFSSDTNAVQRQNTREGFRRFVGITYLRNSFLRSFEHRHHLCIVWICHFAQDPLVSITAECTLEAVFCHSKSQKLFQHADPCGCYTVS